MAAATTAVVYIVVGALVCGIEYRGFKSRFMLRFFFRFHLSSCKPFQHRASIACCKSNCTGGYTKLARKCSTINSCACTNLTRFYYL